MDFIDEQGFRANVGIILTDGSGRVLIAGRRGRGGWQFPQGGIQPEETTEAAMFRELREEVGSRAERRRARGLDRGLAALPVARSLHSPRADSAVHRPEAALVLAAVHGDESRVRFDCSPQPEFDRCRWVDYWRPVKEVVYFKRPVYVRALHELAPLAFPE